MTLLGFDNHLWIPGSVALATLLVVALGLIRRRAAIAKAVIAPLAALGLLTTASFVVLAWHATDDADAVGTVMHTIDRTRAVISLCERMLASVHDADIGQRTYLVTGDARFLEDGEAAQSEVGCLAAALQYMIDDPAQARRLKELEALATTQLESLNEATTRALAGSMHAAMQWVRKGEGIHIMRQLHMAVASMVAEQHQRLAEQHTRALSLHQHHYDIARQLSQAGMLLLLVLGGMLGAVIYLDGANKRTLAVAGERLRNEIALRDREHWFRNLIDALPQLVWTGTTDGTATFLSRQWETFTGGPISALLGRGWLGRLHADDRERLLSRLRGPLPPQQRIEAEIRIKAVDGGYRWFKLRAIANPAANGSPDAWIGNFTDIDDLIEARSAALAQSQEHFDLAVETGELGYWELDLQTGRLTWSTGLFRIMGYPDSPDRSVDLARWRERMHPEDLPRALAAVEDARIKKTPYHAVFRICRADDGRLSWLEDAGICQYDASDKALRMVGVVRDVTPLKLADEALRQSAVRLQHFVDAAPVAIAMFDLRMHFIAASQRFIDDYRLDASNLIGRNHYDVFPEIPERLREIHRRCLQGAVESCDDERFERRDGSVLWGRWAIQPWRDETGNIGGIVLFTEDLTQRKLAQQALFREKERAQVTLHSIGDGVITIDADERIEYLNPVAEALTGWSSAAAFGEPLTQVFTILDEHDRSPASFSATGRQALAQVSEHSHNAILVSRDGAECTIAGSAAPIRDADGRMLGSVLVFRDVTEARRLARQLEHDASHDPLTGLANRRAFEIRLAHAVKRARDNGYEHAVCFIDLDQFKVVNDSAGHPAGDALLKQVPKLLAAKLREGDMVARLGGDEFAILLEHCALSDAVKIAERIVAAFADWRFSWDGRPYVIGASIGVVAITEDAADEGVILARADVACYAAKEAGRNCVHAYHASGSPSSMHHTQLKVAAGLKEAIEQDRFRLFCQPIIPLSRAPNQHPRHFEILIRMLDDAGGLILPGQFIPAAERYGMMASIDRWVIRRAFAQFVQGGSGDRHIDITINLSGTALGRKDFTDYVLDQFALTGMPPHRVCFEITETAAIQKFEHAVAFAERMRAIGSKIALDDFGSGLSSFKYLRYLPTDYLKIDGAFVQGMLDNDKDQAMVAAINDIGHQLGSATIAEYVDQPAMIARLRELGVDYAQGYAIGKPAPFETALTTTVAA